MSAPAYVVRWPYQGDKPAPGHDAESLTQWLECVADGRAVFTGGVGDGHEPEDMCLGRDLDEFVEELNRVAAERAALLAAAKRTLAIHEDVACSCAGCGDLRAAIAKAEGES